ncbi:MAG: 50S ribosomal protein L2 [Verrucomicrobia bacterium]|nr:50S ribosomal protein L2 [Verrucomicrobiota bacterium]
MGIRTYRPYTSSIRFKASSTFEELTRDTPEKSLTESLRRTGGRNCYGRLTMRHRGGGHKQRYRIVDFRRNKHGMKAKVESIEYDPVRSARIALLCYADGEKRYILAPVGLEVGKEVESGPGAPPEVGNALPLRTIPMGMPIHNIELARGRGGQLVRSAGMAATLMAKEGDYANVKLPSGEIRRVHLDCYATLGQVGNLDHEAISYGKAGKSRHLGWRPTVRGMAMNPIDHPNGGGQGKSKGGGGWHHPVSPWGQLAKGLKTRKKHKPTDRFIIQHRPRK